MAVPEHDNSGPHSALEPFRQFPRRYAYLLALGKDESLARKRRRGERPTTLRVYRKWLQICRRLGLLHIAQESLQALADEADLHVGPKPSCAGLRSPAEELADVSRAFGSAMAGFLELANDEDGLTPSDAKRILPDIYEIVSQAVEVAAALERLAAEDDS